MEHWIGHVFPTIFQIMKYQSVGGKLALLIRKVIAMSNMEMLKAHFDTFPIYLPHSSTSRNKSKNITWWKLTLWLVELDWSSRSDLDDLENFYNFRKFRNNSNFFETSKFSRYCFFGVSELSGNHNFREIIVISKLFWTRNSGIGICLFSVPVMFFLGSFSHVSGS